MNNNTQSSENIEQSIHHTNDISSLMNSISVNNEMLFDEDSDSNNIIAIMEKIFKDDLMIESKTLLVDKVKLNNMMVYLIKESVIKLKFKNVSKLFIEFCDFFDLPYNKVFIQLHEKIQNLIKFGYSNLIGKENFKKLNKKYNPNKDNIKTLFDIL